MRNLIVASTLVLAGLGILLSVGAADSPLPPAAAQSAAPLSDRVFENLTLPHRRSLLSLRVTGIVTSRPVDVGDDVNEGDLLAGLASDTERASLKISRLKATSDHEVRAAEMSEKQAEVEYGRVNDLFKRDMATKWEHEKAKVEWDIAKIRTQYAHFQHSLIGLELARDQAALLERELRAPWSGTISRTFKEVGEAVQESAPMMEIAQYNPLRIELNVPDEDPRLGIAVGQKAMVDIDGVNTQGFVVVVSPDVDAASGTFRVRVEVPNPDKKFQAGKLARVRFLNEKVTPPAKKSD